LIGEADAIWKRTVPDQGKSTETELRAYRNHQYLRGGLVERASQIFRGHLTRQIKERVNIYKETANLHQVEGMLWQTCIDELRACIMTDVMIAIQVLQSYLSQEHAASGHKFGLAPLGVGWALWREKEDLPEELIFDVNYLGGNMPTFALNFSRPGSEVLAQYLMLTGLGRDGYTRVMREAQDVAVQLSSEIAQMGPYELLSEGRQLPVFAFKLRDEVDNYSVFDVSDQLRQAGWLVPAYTFPENLQDMSVLRIVVRAGMTAEMADLLLDHLREKTEFLQSLTAPLPSEGRVAFSHN